ncbi:MAG: hypothetical protein JW981_01730 [Anaerolineae bacterium]|nr:hypothetical protein [Anaerolineae bacterium]
MYVNVQLLRQIAEIEFADIVMEVLTRDINEIRIILCDDSFIDIWYSLKLTNRYSYHWERKAIDGTIYRHDNAPHQRWQNVDTFPSHFHNGNESQVIPSYISLEPEKALREFLEFAREKIISWAGND